MSAIRSVVVAALTFNASYDRANIFGEEKKSYRAPQLRNDPTWLETKLHFNGSIRFYFGRRLGHLVGCTISFFLRGLFG